MYIWILFWTRNGLHFLPRIRCSLNVRNGTYIFLEWTRLWLILIYYSQFLTLWIAKYLLTIGPKGRNAFTKIKINSWQKSTVWFFVHKIKPIWIHWEQKCFKQAFGCYSTPSHVDDFLFFGLLTKFSGRHHRPHACVVYLPPGCFGRLLFYIIR